MRNELHRKTTNRHESSLVFIRGPGYVGYGECLSACRDAQTGGEPHLWMARAQHRCSVSGTLPACREVPNTDGHASLYLPYVLSWNQWPVAFHPVPGTFSRPCDHQRKLRDRPYNRGLDPTCR